LVEDIIKKIDEKWTFKYPRHIPPAYDIGAEVRRAIDREDKRPIVTYKEYKTMTSDERKQHKFISFTFPESMMHLFSD
jgi:hypothetical protein